jgi:hypothetical protein
VESQLETEGPTGEEVTTRVSVLGSFLLHAAAAMLISPIVVFAAALCAVLIFKNSSGVNSVLDAGGVASPFLWGPGLILGLLINRFALRSTACWVWLVGVAWIAYGVFAAIYSYHAHFGGICSPFDSIRDGFFSIASRYCGDHSNVMIFTMPALNSIGYSLGACVAMRLGGGRKPDLL